MNVLITRHAETDYNANPLVFGEGHEFVNEIGVKQIEKLLLRLESEKIDSIISSSLTRAQTTAKPIAEKFGIKIKTDDLLREKSDGDFEGKKIAEIDWDSLAGGFEGRHAPNGESLEMVRERVMKFIDNLKTMNNQDQTILVVSHGSYLKVLFGQLLGMRLYDSIFKLNIGHCSLTKVVFDQKYKEGYQVMYMAENSYIS